MFVMERSFGAGSLLAVGLIIGRVAAGQLDLTTYLSGGRGRR